MTKDEALRLAILHAESAKTPGWAPSDLIIAQIDAQLAVAYATMALSLSDPIDIHAGRVRTASADVVRSYPGSAYEGYPNV